MSENEALEKIKQLLYKYRISKSKKMKEFYLNDIITLQLFLEMNYNNTVIEDTNMLEDVSFDIEDIIDDEFVRSINEFNTLNDKTKNLANGCINIFDKAGFISYYALNYPKYDTNLLKDSLLEFLDSIDPKVLEKFYEISKEKIFINNLGDSYDGVCFNFNNDNKQIIMISNDHYMSLNKTSEVRFFSTLAHEFGHVVHNNTINKSGKNKNYITAFTESISILYEKMYLDYLEKNNIDITKELRNEYSLFLSNSLLARAGSLAVQDNNLYFDYIIPDDYFTKEYFDKYTYVFGGLYSADYLDPLIYFYGELIATKYLDEYKSDYKNASKDLLEILMRLESSDSLTLLNEIDLNRVPKGVAKTLRKIKY